MSQHHHHDHDHDHDHDHEHGHGHGHHHHHAPGDNTRAFAISVGLNSLFVIIEFAYGFIANSTALMADAGHNLSDVLGLLLAWGAARLAKTKPDQRYTYGLRSTSILAALGNASLLMVACGAIAWEAVLRFAHPPEVAGLTVSVIAGIGVLVNGFSALLFMSGRKDDLNVRGAYLHMAADAAISLGVVLSGLSLAIVLVIVMGTWSLLRESVQLALAAVPANISVEKVHAFLVQRPGVSEVHDLHIWAMSTTETALTAHVVMPGGYPGDAVVDGFVEQLQKEFRVHHCTLQVEEGTTDHGCVLHEGAH
jgi:cobalt-zinc-cadmium efflux system protein